MNFQFYINNNLFYIVNKKKTLFQVCSELNQNIPIYCYHDKLSIVGNCRMCLIENIGSIKPIISCSKLIDSSVKQIILNSILVKKIREGISQFLLYNHPLDCPICDQGGECDLQDQSMIYGTDSGRYFNNKRTIKEYYYGYFIKGVMTRCIHCTRCIRFLNEVTLQSYFGTIGRGSVTEISNYLHENMDNILSGNLIDLCPVGALTSKLFSYTYRPWELKSFYTYDIMDSFMNRIRIDLNEFNICRILPVYNFKENEEWISNKIRFGYDSFNKYNLYFPLMKDSLTNNLIKVSWKYILIYLINFFRKIFKINLKTKFNLFLGNSLDLRSLFWIKSLIFLTNKKNQFYLINEYKSNNLDNINLYFKTDFHKKFNSNTIKKVKYGLFININFDLESPVFFYKLILKKNTNVLTKFGLIGSFFKKFQYYGKHLGNNLLNYFLFIFGKHFYNSYFNNSIDSNFNIFTSIYYKNNLEFFSLIFLKKFLNFFFCKSINIYNLSLGIGDSNITEIYLPNIINFENKKIQNIDLNHFLIEKNNLNLNYCINVNNKIFNCLKNDFNILQTNQIGLSYEYLNIFDLYFPNLNIYNDSSEYLNMKGNLIYFNILNTQFNSNLQKKNFKILKFFYEIYLHVFCSKKLEKNSLFFYKKDLLIDLIFKLIKKKILSNNLNLFKLKFYNINNFKINNFKFNNLYLNKYITNKFLYLSNLNKLNNLIVNLN